MRIHVSLSIFSHSVYIADGTNFSFSSDAKTTTRYLPTLTKTDVSFVRCYCKKVKGAIEVTSKFSDSRVR